MEVRIPGALRSGGGSVKGDLVAPAQKPPQFNLKIKLSPKTKNFSLGGDEEEEEDEKISVYQSSCTDLTASDDLPPPPPRANSNEETESEEEEDGRVEPTFRTSRDIPAPAASSALRSLLNDLTNSFYRRVNGVDERTVLMRFNAKNMSISSRTQEKYETLCKKFRMTFICWRSDCAILRKIFRFHGMEEEPNYMMMPSCNVIWTGGHVRVPKPLLRQQRINHFPRSHEMTRKDRMICNFQNMQRWKGYKHYNFLPTSFIYPRDKQEIFQEFAKWKKCTADKSGCLWIVKPLASSRGRGIYLISDTEELPLHDCVLVSRYISNPQLIDGVKFDLRIYVAVTSFDPLVAYVYEEGLTRFATVKYKKSMTNYSNHYMHLTNYSINKTSSGYVRCEKADVEDFGNKWTLSALLRYLRNVEGCDTKKLMVQIEDVIIKTLISVQPSVASGTKTYADFVENCFEVYGFDILIDADLKPWLLEVNMSPSLACDAPLDMKVKSQMLCDLLGLVGVPLYDVRRDREEHKRVIAAKFAAERAAVYATSKIAQPNPEQSEGGSAVTTTVNNNNSNRARGRQQRDCGDKLCIRSSSLNAGSTNEGSGGGEAGCVDGSGGCGGGDSKFGVVVEEIFSTDAIMRDLRKSYVMAEKTKKVQEGRKGDDLNSLKNNGSSGGNHSEEALKVILNPHVRVSSATRSRMEKRLRERESRRLAAAREKSTSGCRERAAPAFVKRVIEESHRTGGWLRIFPEADSWESYSYFMENGSSKKTMALCNFLWPGLKLKGRESKALHADELAERKLRPPSVGEEEEFNFFMEASRSFKCRMKRYESSLSDCGLFQIEAGLDEDLDSETETIAWCKSRHEMVRRKKTKKEMIRERRLVARREERGREDINPMKTNDFNDGKKLQREDLKANDDNNVKNSNEATVKVDVDSNNNAADRNDEGKSDTAATTDDAERPRTTSRHRRSTSCVTLGGGGAGGPRGRRSLSIDKTATSNGGKKKERRELLEFARYQREELVVLDGSRLKSKTGSLNSSTTMTTTTTSATTTLPEIGERSANANGKEEPNEASLTPAEMQTNCGGLTIGGRDLCCTSVGDGNALKPSSVPRDEEASIQSAMNADSATKKDGDVASRRFCSSVVAAIRTEEKSLTVAQARRAFGRFLVLLHTRFDKALQIAPQQPEQQTSATSRQQHHHHQLQQPRESELKLVCTFLKRAAANFAYNFSFEAPTAAMTREQRVKAVGEQLGKFVDIYLKESVVVIRTEKTGAIDRKEASTAVRSKTFDAFLSMATEKEVEELLTYHARVKKSIDMFFGSPIEKKRPKDDGGSEGQQQSAPSQGTYQTSPQRQNQPQLCSRSHPATVSKGIVVKLPQPTLRQPHAMPARMSIPREATVIRRTSSLTQQTAT